MNLFTRLAAGAALSAGLLSACLPALAQTTVLRVVPHSNLAILDPIWTTAYMKIGRASCRERV